MINAERAAQDAVLEEMSKVLDDLKDVAETIGDVRTRCGCACSISLFCCSMLQTPRTAHSLTSCRALLFFFFPTAPQELTLQEKQIADLDKKTDKTQGKLDKVNDRAKHAVAKMNDKSTNCCMYL